MRIFWPTFALIFLMISCQEKKIATPKKIDLKEIRKKGKLTVLMENSSLSYFEYRGKKLGFEYEFMDTFCKSIGVELEVKIISRPSDYKDKLINCEGDVIASNLMIPFKHEDGFAYSKPYYRTYQVLVQRSKDTIIREPSELAGKDVYVRRGSAFADRLMYLQHEIGAKINVKYKKGDPIAEDLIEMVANNQLPFTIAHENLARISKEMHPNLNISTKLSFLQNIGFGLRHNSK
jgi:membrane-bound lytic murein transglycosylase F